MSGHNEDSVNLIVEALGELQEDTTVPKNVKERIKATIICLKDSCEVSMRIDRALQELDEVSEESNLQAYTRTQIWSIVSMLEKKQL